VGEGHIQIRIVALATEIIQNQSYAICSLEMGTTMSILLAIYEQEELQFKIKLRQSSK